MPAGRVVRLTTVVVTDLVDSTATFLGMPPAAAEALRRRHDEVLGDVVATHAGQVLKNLGDGLLLRFDAAGAAFAAAVAMQQAMAELALDAAMDLRMRVGIAVGDVTWEPSDVFGRPVVEAARLCSAAAPAGILATAAAVRCAPDAVGVGPPEPRSLKGFDEAVTTHVIGWEPAVDVVVPLPPGLDAAPRLVGRDAEVAELRSCWATAAVGGGAAVAVAGEPGIGKTSLLADVASHVHRNGGVVLHGRCYQGALAPYRPVVEALEEAVGHLSTLELRRAAGKDAHDLARLLPGLHERLPGLPPPIRTDASAERQRLFAAVSSFLAGLAVRRPVLLVVDDLQWADEGTAQLVRHVVAERPAGVAVVLAHRSGEEQVEQGAAMALAEIDRQGGARLALAGIGVDAVATLVEDQLQEGDARALALDLVARTGGNPFSVREVIAALAAGRDDVPRRVRDVLTERLDRLPARTLEALVAVAVTGRDASLDLVADVLGAGVDGPDGALAALEAGLAAGVLVELAGGGRFRCAHDLIRATAYEGQTETRRARRHLAVADHLELRVPDHDPSEVARHLDVALVAQPSLTARTARAWLAASSAARAQLAYELARSAAERGLAVVAAGRPHLEAEPAVEPELQRALADACFCLGDYPASTEAGRRAARLAGIRDLPVLRAEALVGMARIEDQGRADPFLGQALTDMLEEPDLPPPLQVRLLAATARYLAWNEGRVAEARELAVVATTQADVVDDVDAAREALWAWVVAHEGSNEPDARAAVGTRLLALADRYHDDQSRAVGHFVRAMARLELGNRLAFDDDVTDFEAVARRRGGRFELANASAFRRLQQWLDGDLEALEAAAGVMLGDGSDHQAFVIYAMSIVLIRREQGRQAEVAPGLAASRVVNPGYQPTIAAFAAIQADLGQVEEPRAALDALAPGAAAAVEEGVLRPAVLAWLAEVAASVGTPEHQEQLLAALEPYRGLVVVIGNVGCLGAVDRYLGLLELALGRVAAAVATLEAAVELDTRLRAPAQVAWSTAYLAVALDRSGAGPDRARAEELRARVRETSERLGLAAVRRLVDGEVGSGSPSS